MTTSCPLIVQIHMNKYIQPKISNYCFIHVKKKEVNPKITESLKCFVTVLVFI